MPVTLRSHTDRGDAEAEEAGVVSRKLRFDLREIREIIVQDFGQLGVLHPGRAAPDRQYFRNAGIDQAFAQDALPDHAGGAEQDRLHVRMSSTHAFRVSSAHPLMNASRSALMVAASVVGMPCGKPL